MIFNSDLIIKSVKTGLSDYALPASDGMFIGYFINQFYQLDEACALNSRRISSIIGQPQLQKVIERIHKNCRALIHIGLMAQAANAISLVANVRGFSGLPRLIYWGMALSPLPISILSDDHKIFQITHNYIGVLSKTITAVSGVALIVFGQPFVGGGMLMMIGVEEVINRKILPERVGFVLNKGLVLFRNINLLVSGGMILKAFGLVGVISFVSRNIFPEKAPIVEPIHKLTVKQLQGIVDGKIFLKINKDVDLEVDNSHEFRNKFFTFLNKEKETALAKACKDYVSVIERMPALIRPFARIWFDLNAFTYSRVALKYYDNNYFNELSCNVFKVHIARGFDPFNLHFNWNGFEHLVECKQWWKDWVSSQQDLSPEEKIQHCVSIETQGKIFDNSIIAPPLFKAMLADMGVMQPM